MDDLTGKMRCINCAHRDGLEGDSCAYVLRFPIAQAEWTCENWTCQSCGKGWGAQHGECFNGTDFMALDDYLYTKAAVLAYAQEARL